MLALLDRAFRYLFVRRLAIKPKPPCSYCHGTGYCGASVCSCYMWPAKRKLIFQWQKMPEGYRWF